MIVRSLDILDLPLLSYYRKDILALDTARMLTRGDPLGTMALLSYLDPRHHVYTALAADDGDSLMGQVTLQEEETSARVTFLAPGEHLNGLTPPLLDHLVAQAGEWGAFHLLAEVDDESPAFRCLRQAGFAMYAWQRVWKMPASLPGDAGELWRSAAETDWPAIQSLYGQIIPALLHPVEMLPKQVVGMVCRPQGNLQAYVTVKSGSKGFWIQPIIPPESDCVSEQLSGLAHTLGAGQSRPVYVCVRSYQAWLESVLADLGAEAGPRQAVMVRRLVKTVKELQPLPVMEPTLVKAKPAAPINRIESEK